MSEQFKFISALVMLVLFAILFAVFIIRMVYKSQLKQLAYIKTIEEIKTKHDKLILQTQLDMQEETFLEISHEIHDHISLSLSLCKMQLNTLNFKRPGEAKEKIGLSKDLLARSISGLNDISRTLDSEQICRIGFVQSVEDELAHLERTGLFVIDFECTGTPFPHMGKSAMILFRIFQEALNNIIKHSGADYVTIRITYSEKQMECMISDNGDGFDLNEHVNKSKGLGLANMKKRARLLDAHLEVASVPLAGTMVKIVLPNVNDKIPDGKRQ